MDKNDFLSNSIILEDMDEIFSQNVSWEKLKNKTVLVTGAYGMLASYMVFMLIYLNEIKQYNIHIIAMVRDKEKLFDRFGKYVKKSYFEPFYDSILEPIQYKEKIDFIIHAASFASPQYYTVCPIDVSLPNSVGTYNLLELAVNQNVESFLYFSTASIYGKVENKEFITESDYSVIDPLNIHSCYDESKRMGETLCKAYFWQKNVPTRIVRISHTYGPTMNLEADPRVFAEFVRNVIHGQDITIKSSGNGKRTFCYLSDATAAYFMTMLHGLDGEAYNVCNTQELHSISELAKIIASIYPEKNIGIVYKERNKETVYLEDENANSVACSSQKIQEIGWKCTTKCSRGFRRTIESIFQYRS